MLGKITALFLSACLIFGALERNLFAQDPFAQDPFAPNPQKADPYQDPFGNPIKKATPKQDPFGNLSKKAKPTQDQPTSDPFGRPSTGKVPQPKPNIKITGQDESNSRDSIIERIDAALSKKISMDLSRVPLVAFTNELTSQLGISVQLDLNELEAVAVAPDTPLQCRLENISVRSAIKQTLKPLDLTIVIRDEMLVVTTQESAEQQLSPYIIDVTNLVRPSKPTITESGPLEVSAYKSESKSDTEADLESLITVINTTIHPDHWDEAGGPCSMGTFSVNQKHLLVLSATLEVHTAVVDLLNDIRRVANITDAR